MTVRALRHYDEIGLLRPASRTAVGHRRYDRGRPRRLYRVRARLRALGLSLEEIAGVLAADGRPGRDARGAAPHSCRCWTAQAERLDRVRRRMHGMLRAARRGRDAGTGPVHDDFGDDLSVRELFHAGAAGTAGGSGGTRSAPRPSRRRRPPGPGWWRSCSGTYGRAHRPRIRRYVTSYAAGTRSARCSTPATATPKKPPGGCGGTAGRRHRPVAAVVRRGHVRPGRVPGTRTPDLSPPTTSRSVRATSVRIRGKRALISRHTAGPSGSRR